MPTVSMYNPQHNVNLDQCWYTTVHLCKIIHPANMNGLTFNKNQMLFSFLTYCRYLPTRHNDFITEFILLITGTSV